MRAGGTAAATHRPGLALPATRVQAAAAGGLLCLWLAAAALLRSALAGRAGPASLPAGLVFGLLLTAGAVAGGWHPGRVRAGPLLLGLAGAALLVGLSAARVGWHLRLAAAPTTLLPWAAVVTLIAAAEELLLRGALFSRAEAAGGLIAAVAATSTAFALIHLPLYGLRALPLDLAAGVWLGGLRVLGGGVAAPATAHVLADLSTAVLG